MQPSSTIILKLNNLVIHSGQDNLGPLNLEITEGSDHTLILDNLDLGLELIRVIKGISTPIRGRVIKKDKNVTGWIVPDGCIALIEHENFFSATVREEIAFAASVGKARGKVRMIPLLDRVLQVSGLGEHLFSAISELRDAEKQILALASTLLMTPALIIFLNPLAGMDQEIRVPYLQLLEIGKQSISFSTLQIGTSRTFFFSSRAFQGTLDRLGRNGLSMGMEGDR